MAKYVNVNTGKPVNMGDVVFVKGAIDGHILSIPLPVSKETLPNLISYGYIKEDVDSHTYETISDYKTIQKIIDNAWERIAYKSKWKYENLSNYVHNLYKLNPMSVFIMLAREIAVMMDERYENHIKDSKQIWTFDMFTGEIVQVKDKTKIKTFRHFPAFRSLEDAKEAKYFLQEFLKDLFGKSGK